MQPNDHVASKNKQRMAHYQRKQKVTLSLIGMEMEKTVLLTIDDWKGSETIC